MEARLTSRSILPSRSARSSRAPLVSVLLPVRAWRATTAAAVASVLAQDVGDLELLVIGHDDVDALLARLPPDARLRGVRRAAPGIVGALASGIAAARGRYLARMDDDDIAYPGRLGAQLDHLAAHPDLALLGARVRLVDAAGERAGVGPGNRRYEAWLNALTTPAAIRDACFVECPLPHPTWLAHRDVWARLGGYRDLDGPEDHDLVLRARNAGIRMGKPAPVLLDWREHPERLTRRDPRYRREAFAEVRARAALDPASGFGLEAGRAAWICGTGRNARWWCDALVRHGAEVSGFVDLDRPDARRHKRHRPVVTYTELWARRGESLLVTAITNPEARAALVGTFAARGLVNGRDYLLGG